MLTLCDISRNDILRLKSKNNSIQGEVYNIELTKEINGTKTLNFVLPLYTSINGQQEENFRWNYIQNELLIKLVYKNEEDWFKIKTIEDIHDSNGTLTSNIQCVHISDILNKKNIDKTYDITGNALTLITEVLNDSGFSVGIVDTFYNDNNEEKIRTLRSDSKSNAMTHLQTVSELFGGYLRFNGDKTVDLLLEIGQDNGIEFRYKKNLKNIKRIVESSDVITKLYAEGGQDEIGTVTINEANPTGQSYILDFSYFIESGLMPQELVDKITLYQTDITNAQNNINSIQTSLTSDLGEKAVKEGQLSAKELEKQSTEQVIEELNDKIDIATGSEKTNLINERNDYTSQLNTINNEITALKNEIAVLNGNISNYNSQLQLKINDKNSINTQFQTDLDDFIIEGLHTDTNFITSQSLYDDTKEVLSTACKPRVSYEMDILNLSVLTGHELEVFNLGDKVYVTDSLLRVRIDAKITKMTEILDKQWDVKVEIANFDTDFEQLFKELAKNIEIMKQKKEQFRKVEKSLQADGSITYQMLQETFDRNKFEVKYGSQSSVITDENGITVIDVADPNKMVRINGGIITLTEDGGNSWTVAMTPRGINFKKAIGGRLDINEIAIWGNNQFYWNHNGLYAINPDNPNQMIKYDNTGIVALDNGTERVRLGRHSSNKYGLLIRNKTGNKTILDEDGLLSSFQQSMTDNMDASTPAILKFYIPENTGNILNIKLSLSLEKFRSYVKTLTQYGETKTSTYWGTATYTSSLYQSHSHSISSWNGEIPSSTGSYTDNHSHTVDLKHDHDVNLTHNHQIEYGVFEGSAPTNLRIFIDGVDRTQSLGGTRTGVQTIDELNITPYITSNGWHTIQFNSDSIGRIVAHIFGMFYMYAPE